MVTKQGDICAQVWKFAPTSVKENTYSYHSQFQQKIFTSSDGILSHIAINTIHAFCELLAYLNHIQIFHTAKYVLESSFSHNIWFISIDLPFMSCTFEIATYKKWKIINHFWE